ncbi:hypothetical protein JYU34_016163 [Plutella xylostella]|uniref:Uncharacterized protein n=1 Tax=Plutella xylostella TaxID=51655 RepID=A0ABQ7Q5J2_PLUXY|nr:hypothetical protein JYU34_016163 [Plutella xylostella]
MLTNYITHDVTRQLPSHFPALPAAAAACSHNGWPALWALSTPDTLAEWDKFIQIRPIFFR